MFLDYFGPSSFAHHFRSWFLPGCFPIGIGRGVWTNFLQCPYWEQFSAPSHITSAVAFGSLVIAVIRMIRLVLDYVEKKCRKLNNEIGRCVLCFCKACLWCLEKFMRFINRNAFIMCAVNGTNFCKSAKDAFNLITRNFVRIVVLNSVCDFLLFIGKVFIIVACGSVSYLAFGGYIPHIRDDIPALNYFFIPCVFIVIGSYLIATAFFSVYSMAVDTLFLCFLEDLERNDGSLEKPYHMSRKLMKILGRKN